MKNHSTRFHCKKILRTNHEVTTLLMTILMILTVSTFGFSPPAYASEKSPYDSGYDHGCDDADISDSSERYINQPEKGPSFHTSEFMDGYNTGFSQCSGNDSNDGSSGNDGNSQGSSESGYAQGKSDYQNNRQYDDRCDPDMSDAACALYKADYAAGWGATAILRPETRNN